MPSEGRHHGKRHKPRGRPTPAENDSSENPQRPNNLRTGVVNTPDPILYGVASIVAIFGITFLIVGSVHSKNCKLEPMLPIWLLVLGLILGIGGCWMFFLSMRIKREPFRPMKFSEKMVSILLLTIFFVWFIAGNVWVYKSWGEHPDYGHTWFSNGCDKSVFFLSFVAIIVLDALMGLLLIGFCFWGMTKIIVRE